MKRIVCRCGLLAACLLWTVGALRAQQPMQYRIVPVGSSQWMNPKQIEAVHEQVDRIAADGYNVISIGTYTFLPMHIIDYTDSPYPEAAEYSTKKVMQNLETLRENIAYAKSRGIRYVVTRSYSHYAPYKFWCAHQPELNPDGVFDQLLLRAHQNDMYRKALAGKSPNCVPQQQWTNPCFREFFLWSTERALDLLPELDGFLNAYAEAAWTYDVEKVRTNNWRSWKECVDYAKTDSCFVDYSNRLAKMLREKRGEEYFFGMRDWYVKPEVMQQLDIPREKLVLSVKYAGYDQPLENYPPWGKQLLDDGYGVVLDIHVYDAEYPHPVYWYDNNIVNRIYANLREADFTGVVYQDYSLRGEDTADNPVRRLTQLTVAGAMNQQPWSDADAERFLAKTYRKAAPYVLQSLKSVARAQLQFIKLMPAWFWRGDGLSVGGVQPLQFWQLFDNPEAPVGMAFVRQEVVGVPEYCAAWRTGARSDEQLAEAYHAENRLTPIDVLREMAACADRAVEMAEQARVVTPKHAPYLADIIASAYLHRTLCQRNIALVEAAMHFYKSGYIYNGKYEPSRERVYADGPEFGAECIAALERCVQHDYLMRRIMAAYSPRRRALRHANTYKAEQKVAAVLKRKIDLEDHTEPLFEALCREIERK